MSKSVRGFAPASRSNHIKVILIWGHKNLLLRLFKLTGKYCLILLALCLVFQVMFVAMASAVSGFTDPPACQVGLAFPIPYAACPGFGFEIWVDYALALPGAVLALPFILPSLIADTSAPLQPFVIVPLTIHMFAMGYLITLAIDLWRTERSR